mmetsp:Transcript_56436/g.150320  ORF Transcript_56436/g.150320 Transcript_56436/m.150320 type:complete len:241 (-) Transcript_56436:79-801(-)
MQNLIDLRREGWKTKVYIEGAKKVADIHKAAKQLQKEGQMFEVTIAGARPSHLHELTVQRPGTQVNTKMVAVSAESPAGQKPAVAPWLANKSVEIDENRLKSTLSYFLDDHDSTALVEDFAKMNYSADQKKTAAKWLLDAGFTAAAKRAAKIAEAVVALVTGGVLDGEAVSFSLRRPLDNIDDLALDNPEARQFYFQLVDQAMDCESSRWALLPLVNNAKSEPLVQGLSAKARAAYDALS